MVVGSGLIATAFKPYFQFQPDVIIFASGVSNSGEVRQEEFLREKEYLISYLGDEKIIYFSTCSLDDPELTNTPYVSFKREMESIVRTAKNYLIVRLPQVVGKTNNPNTLTNYLNRQILSGSSFNLWNQATRNLIDIDDVAKIVNLCVRSSIACNTTINVAAPFSVSIRRLVQIFEQVLGICANYEIVDAGGAYPIRPFLPSAIETQLGIVFNEDYIEKLIRKYYAN